MQWQMYHLAPMVKEAHGHKEQYQQQANTTTVGVKLDCSFKIRFKIDVLVIK